MNTNSSVFHLIILQNVSKAVEARSVGSSDQLSGGLMTVEKSFQRRARRDVSDDRR